MSNPYGYNERFMHSQRSKPWADVHLGKSDATMAGFGCVVTGVAYVLSRFTDHDINPGEWVNWCNRRGGFNAKGEFLWGMVAKFTKGKLSVSLWNPLGAKYVGHWVDFAGQDHFVIQLRNPKTGKTNLLFDPWLGGVVPETKYKASPRRVLKWVYFRI